MSPRDQDTGSRLRILVISYYFPPLNSIASHRPYSWAAAWSAAGHEVHVLTTDKYAFDGTLDLEYDLSAFQVHSVGYMSRAPRAQAIRHGDPPDAAQRWDRFKLATRRVRLGLGMYGEIAWLAYRPLLARALELARGRRFDFVITTSPPEVVHFVGHALQRKAGIPWVADYRDLWFAEMRVGMFRASSWLTGRIKRPRLREARPRPTGLLRGRWRCSLRRMRRRAGKSRRSTGKRWCRRDPLRSRWTP